LRKAIVSSSITIMSFERKVGRQLIGAPATLPAVSCANLACDFATWAGEGPGGPMVHDAALAAMAKSPNILIANLLWDASPRF
jgi:hypothetical protein